MDLILSDIQKPVVIRPPASVKKIVSPILILFIALNLCIYLHFRSVSFSVESFVYANQEKEET